MIQCQGKCTSARILSLMKQLSGTGGEEAEVDMTSEGTFSVEYMVVSTMSTPEERADGDASAFTDRMPMSPKGGEDNVDDLVPLQSIAPMSVDQLDVDHDDTTVWLRSLSYILGQAALPTQAVQNLEQGDLYVLSVDEPISLEEAEQLGN
jgi:hypothetical protein